MHAGLFDLCIIISFGEKIGHILEPLYLLPIYATLLVASSISPVDTTPSVPKCLSLENRVSLTTLSEF
jgi:hypothetical protein